MAARDGGTSHPPFADRLTTGQLLGIDCVIAAITLTLIMFNASFHHGFDYRIPGIPVAMLAAGASVPAAVRRVWPIPAFAVIMTAVAALTAMGITPFTL